MTNDIPPRERTRTRAVRRTRPEEKWSGINRLPPDEARAIEIERNLEIAGAFLDLEGLAEHHTIRMASALDRLKNIDAQDAVESMLATFMLQTQALATRAAHAASLESQFAAVASAHVDRYMRLSIVFLKQAEALTKHRLRGGQGPADEGGANSSDRIA